MKKRTENKGYHQGTHYADDLNTIEELAPYLCTAAVVRGGPPQKRGPQPEVCRACEAQCTYGRKLVRLWDAQQKEGAEKMPRAKATADQMTIQEQLEAKMQECMQLHAANHTMMTEVRELSAELAEAKEALAKREEELNKLHAERREAQIALWKLKARLYDKEHEWED